MTFKLIACEVFYREVCACVAASPHRVDIEFTPKGAHDKSDSLRELLQSKIDAAEAGEQAWDAILLGFGLCGNSTRGLAARKTRLVIPRAHDCCTIFLGSRERFRENFKDNPSLPFSSTGYMERGGSSVHDASVSIIPGLGDKYEEYVRQYGEENAKYIMESLTASVSHAVDGQADIRWVFIDVPELSHLGFAEKCRAEAEASGRQFVLLPGDMRLVRGLVNGQWDPSEFLVVEPGQKIGAVYDWDEILRAEKA
jgi:hypothetical protein